MTVATHDHDETHFAELANTAATGDHSAVNDVLRILQPEITRYCRASVRPSQDTYVSADDVAQEAMIGLFQALKTSGSTPRCLRSFSFGITRNKIYDHHRKAAREQRAQLDEAPDLPDQGPDPESIALHNERSDQLGELLNGLSGYQRDVLVLRQAGSYSAEETARHLGTTAGAVRVTQNRALRNLRRALRRGETAS